MSATRRPKNFDPRATSRVLADSKPGSKAPDTRGDESRPSSDETRHPGSATVVEVLGASDSVPAEIVEEIEASEGVPKSRAATHVPDSDDGLAIRHMKRPIRDSLAPAPPPMEPWQPGAQRHRPRERSFTDDARDILALGVPVKLRALVALRTGLPIDVCAAMSFRQAVVLVLLADALEKGQLDKLDRVLDRTDPKSRRVEHSGGVAHLHALAGAVLGMNEAEATEMYRQMVQGGSGAVLEAEASEAD